MAPDGFNKGILFCTMKLIGDKNRDMQSTISREFLTISFSLNVR